MAKGNQCRIEGCERVLTATSGQICQMHRSRWFRNKSYDIPEASPYRRYHKPHPTGLGYLRINIRGKRVLQHRHIMEEHLGRSLAKGETVHHINGIKTDNRIENLKLYKSNGEHMIENHRSIWKARKKNAIYSADQVSSVLQRIEALPKTYPLCFCGLGVEAKNLCKNHYQWAYRHRFT